MTPDAPQTTSDASSTPAASPPPAARSTIPTSGMPAAHNPPPELSIVVPALDEQDNVGPLVEQVARAVRGETDDDSDTSPRDNKVPRSPASGGESGAPVAAGVDAELIVVDDGSTDQTLERLRELARTRPWLRVLHRDTPRGQSSAMYAGIQAARGRYVATLDADLQNDPADLPRMLEHCRGGEADMVQGDRSRNRRDNAVRRVGSVVGRRARGLLLKDVIRDTGCSARVVRADVARQFPLMFKGMHRFMPIYAKMLGARIVEMDVGHRPRTAGETKYGLGVVNRAWAGLCDAMAVRWMQNRHRDTAVEADQCEEK